MTQERFLRLLDNPDLLATIPYEEMKTLALAYPYAHNLRYLLALKARQDDHPDADRMMTTASVYSLDRTQLYYLTAVKIPAFQPMAVAEEVVVLELKPIEIVQRELEALSPQSRTGQVAQAATQEIITAPTPAGTTPDVNPATATEPIKAAEIQAPVTPVFSQPFAVWMSGFNPPVLENQKQQQPRNAPLPVEEPHSPTLSAQELAERSVAENKDVISETLARLLAKQGYRDKAINMYERLRLAFPEKSAYFAAEIEKLKK